MKLSSAERLSLLMLCDIYDATQARPDFDTAFVREAIYSGNLWALTHRFQGIEATDIPEEVVREVHNILDMWLFIEEAGGDQFPGFDTSRESEHASAAAIMTEHMGMYDQYKGRVNKGVLQLGSYRRMYEVFEPIRKTLADRNPIRLSQDEVNQIMAARVHPDHR